MSYIPQHSVPTMSDLHHSRMSADQQLPYQDEAFAIIGAAIEVQNELGMGFSELVYHSALNIELTKRGVPFETEKEIVVYYKGEPLDKTYKADLICYDNIIVELKCTECLLPEHTAQLLNYLKATGKQLGILINFGQKPLVRKFVPNHITNK